MPSTEYRTLRELFRHAECRRFRAKNRHNRWGEFLGFGPDYVSIVGWWEGSSDMLLFDADEFNWTSIVIYV